MAVCRLIDFFNQDIILEPVIVTGAGENQFETRVNTAKWLEFLKEIHKRGPLCDTYLLVDVNRPHEPEFIVQNSKGTIDYGNLKSAAYLVFKRVSNLDVIKIAHARENWLKQNV